MANTVNLTTVKQIFEHTDNTKFIVEENGELNRFAISDLNIDSGGDITIDMESGINSEANPINADTLGGYPANYFASQNNVDETMNQVNNNINTLVTNQVNEVINNIDLGSKIELNYSIVGGLIEPSNPIENTIWIETGIPINRVFFGNNKPNETFINGDIWICTGTKSNVAFNALKVGNNYVNMIYPFSAKQYIDNEFTVKTAKSWQNNEWVTLCSNIILYSYGTLNTTYTCTGSINNDIDHLNFTTEQALNTFGKNVIFSEIFDPTVYSCISIQYELVNGHLVSGTVYSSHELAIFDEYGSVISSTPLTSKGYTEIDLSMIQGITSCRLGIRSYLAKNWVSGNITMSTHIYELIARAQ